ncbi:MAG: EamA family transporter [Gammaproteobacteria bacterium]|nr:EamA family transporter [Gammaproteobacteria bacterium]
MKHSPLSGALAILIAATLFGVAGALAKALFHADISPLALTAIRTLLSCALFAGVILAAPRLSFRVRRSALPLLIAVGLAFTAVNVTFYLAISLISVAGAITLEYTAPFFVLILSFIAGGRRITVADVVIVAASVAGCFMLSGDGGAWLQFSPGVLVGLACGLSFAIYNMLGNACKARDIGATTVTFYSFFVSSLLWLVALPFLNLHAIPFTAQSVWYIAFIVVFATILPYWLLLYGLRQVHALPATVIGMLDPLTAGVFAYYLLGETLTPANIIGIVVIIVAVCAFTAKEARTVTRD